MENKLHYGWIVIGMGLLTTVAAHGFGRMAYTLLLPAMKDGLSLITHSWGFWEQAISSDTCPWPSSADFWRPGSGPVP